MIGYLDKMLTNMATAFVKRRCVVKGKFVFLGLWDFDADGDDGLALHRLFCTRNSCCCTLHHKDDITKMTSQRARVPQNLPRDAIVQGVGTTWRENNGGAHVI